MKTLALSAIIAVGMVATPVSATSMEQEAAKKAASDRMEIGTNVDWKAYKEALIKAQKKSGAKPFANDKEVKVWLEKMVMSKGGPEKVRPEDIEKIFLQYLQDVKAKART